MRSIVTVTTAAATPYRLTTLDRVKAELSINGGQYDTPLLQKIDEAGSDIQAFLGFTVARETVTETFRHTRGDESPESLILDRTPVAGIDSVTLDDVVLDAAEYEVDAKSGLLHRLDASGYPCLWSFCKSAVIAYSGGFILPGNVGANLEPAIEGATVVLVTSFWRSRGRDPLAKVIDIPGVERKEFWVGSVGTEGELPTEVVNMISRFRRAAA